MSTPYPLLESVSVVLNGSGNGTARISPGQVAPGASGGCGAGRNSGLTWDVTGVSVNASTNVKEATAKTYISFGIQSAGLNDLQGQSRSGSTGDTDSVALTLKPGDWITTVWSGGDPGAIATMKILGTVNPPGMGN